MKVIVVAPPRPDALQPLGISTGPPVAGPIDAGFPAQRPLDRRVDENARHARAALNRVKGRAKSVWLKRIISRSERTCCSMGNQGMG